jgi:hypothetical protein
VEEKDRPIFTATGREKFALLSEIGLALVGSLRNLGGIELMP